MDQIMYTEDNRKFVKLFGNSEIRLTACAVIKRPPINFPAVSPILSQEDEYFLAPNQFWTRYPNHEKALVKVYKNNPYKNTVIYGSSQITEIRMPFLGNNSDNCWGELQLLIKVPRPIVGLARNQSFDTRLGIWIKETDLIKPKTDFETHSYISLRFYHQDHLPPVPNNWHFEPLYVSLAKYINNFYYKISVLWENNEIKIEAVYVHKDSPEIPSHLK